MRYKRPQLRCSLRLCGCYLHSNFESYCSEQKLSICLLTTDSWNGCIQLSVCEDCEDFWSYIEFDYIQCKTSTTVIECGRIWNWRRHTVYSITAADWVLQGELKSNSGYALSVCVSPIVLRLFCCWWHGPLQWGAPAVADSSCRLYRRLEHCKLRSARRECISDELVRL